jgi:hypothetical protein
MAHFASPDSSAPSLIQTSPAPRTDHLRFLAALRATSPRPLGETSARQTVFFSASEKFLRLSEWTNLPGKEEAEHYLAKWPSKRSDVRIRVLNAACKFLGLYACAYAVPDCDSGLFGASDGAGLLDHFLRRVHPWNGPRGVEILPAFVVRWNISEAPDVPHREIINRGIESHAEARSAFLEAIIARFGAAGNCDGLTKGLRFPSPFNSTHERNETTITMAGCGVISICSAKRARRMD